MKNRNKILVIEDDEDILFALMAVLDIYGYESAGISFVQDVRATIAFHQPDLVLTDYVLPGMNGSLICKAIKGNPVTAHITVILMTAYHKQAIAVGNFGHDAYLPKPFDNNALIGILGFFFHRWEVYEKAMGTERSYPNIER
jgi:DNA-binding response OmpR family regulator